MRLTSVESVSALSQDLITIRDYIRWALSVFAEHDVYLGHGTDDPWDEALGLVLHAIHLSWDADPRVLDARLTLAERQRVIAWIEKRVIERVPLAYITQTAWFADLEFFVDERVLIPRSPIAELIESHFSPLKPLDDIHSILDMCTGCGCIAIACAHHLPGVQVDAVDISEEALSVAKINVDQHQVTVNLSVSDLFEQVSGRYDLIIANPPYASEEEMKCIPAEYHAEPTMALFSAENGLYHVKRLLLSAAEYLSNNGLLIVEVGMSQPEFERVFPCLPVTWLEFARGGQGVFMIDDETLKAQAAYLNSTVGS